MATTFNFNFTKEILQNFFPNNKEIDGWYEALIEILPKYDINTDRRVAAFLAQTAHESGNYTTLKENLNYSASGLAATWPKRFAVPGVKPITPSALAKAIARKPELIANNVYSNRLGNGSAESGDGWKYRGRGLIQLTGKENYSNFAQSIGMDLDEVLEYLETKKGAVESACWFWKRNNLNLLADKQDITLMSKRINGGTIGLNDRKENYETIVALIGDAGAATTNNFYS
jgi:putative chitinase